jgi:hypothetical protein
MVVSSQTGGGTRARFGRLGPPINDCLYWLTALKFYTLSKRAISSVSASSNPPCPDAYVLQNLLELAVANLSQGEQVWTVKQDETAVK